MTAAVQNSPTQAIRNFFSGPGGGVMLVVLVCVCYLMTLTNLYIWDDDAYVTSNPHLVDFNGLSRMWTHVGATPQYYPVTFTSFWLEVQIAGINPKLSHGVNMLLHACNTLLLWVILRRLFVPGAWIAAAIFAVHPINVESVAWVSERKNTLSMAFGLSALLVYLRYAGLTVVEKIVKPAKVLQPGEEEEGEGVKLSLPDDPTRLYLIFLALYACALLSKTTMSMLPLVILVITWWKRGTLKVADVRPLIFPIILGVCAGSLTSWIEQNPYIIGARGPEWQLGNNWFTDKIARVALAGQVCVFYVIKLILPHAASDLVTVKGTPDWLMPYKPWPLLFSYPKWKVDIGMPLQWFASALVALTVVGLYLRRARIGRGALACVGVYLVCLLPAMGFFHIFPQRYSWVADHYAYAAAIGLIVGFSALVTMLLERIRSESRGVIGCVIGGVVLLPLVCLTIYHSRSFKTLPALWAYTLDRNPQSWWVKVNEGNSLIYVARKMKPPSTQPADLAEFNEKRIRYLTNGRDLINDAREIYPDSYEAEFSLATLAANIGNLPQAMRYADRAEATAERMQQVKFLQPKFLKASLYTTAGDLQHAEAIYRDLQRFEPLLSDQYGPALLDARMRLADLLKSQLQDPTGPTMSDHDLKLAADIHEQYRAAIDIMPQNPKPKLELVRLYMDDKFAAVIGALTGGAIDPKAQAATLLAEVVKQDSGDVDAKYATALLALQVNDLTMANNQLLDLIKFYPEYVPAYVKLAEVLDKSGRRKQAEERLEQALALDPDYKPAKELQARFKGLTTQPTTGPTTGPTTAPTSGPAVAPASRPAM